MTLNRPSEIELLIACAQPDATGPRLRSLLSAPVNWDKLRDLACYHRVEALVYTRLSEHAADLVPSVSLAAMADEFRAFSVGSASIDYGSRRTRILSTE